MAWTLTIYDESGDVVMDTVTDEDVTPRIHGGFRVIVRGSGECVSLQFRGRNDLLRIYPRYIVQLNADGHDLFWGVIVKNPSFNSKGSGPADGAEQDLEEYVAEGGRALLAARVSGAKYVMYSTDVGDIFKEFLTLYGHPALTSDLTQIPVTAAVLTQYYRPNSQLDVLLDELVGTLPGWVWGVNAVGQVFLKELDGFLSFDASDLLDFVYRPLIAEDTVSKVQLVIAGSPAGRETEDRLAIHLNPPPNGRYNHTHTYFDYAPRPVVFSYEDPLHSVFRAEKSFALPEGVNPFYEPPDAIAAIGGINPGTGLAEGLFAHNIATVEAIYDGDATTYGAISAGTNAWLNWPFDTLDESVDGNPVALNPIIGFRLVHAGEIDVVADVDYRQSVSTQGYTGFLGLAENYTFVRCVYQLSGIALDEGAIGFYSVYPPAAQMDNINREPDHKAILSNVTLNLQVSSPVSDFRIYHFYPLVLNTEFLTAIAKQNISIPRSMPGDAIVKGYSPPVAIVEVFSVLYAGSQIDSGEIDVSAIADSTVDIVDTLEYILTPQDGFMTRYVIGNRDISEVGTLLSKYVDDSVRTANYSLMMAPRQ